MGETNSVHEARDFPDRWSVDTFLGFNWCGETPARIGRNDLPPLPHGRGKYTWAQLRDKLSVAELRVCRPMRALLMGGCPLTLICRAGGIQEQRRGSRGGSCYGGRIRFWNRISCRRGGVGSGGHGGRHQRRAKHRSLEYNF